MILNPGEEIISDLSEVDEQIAKHPDLEVRYLNYCAFALATHGRKVYSMLASPRHFWLWLKLTKGSKKDRVSQRKTNKIQRTPKENLGRMGLFGLFGLFRLFWLSGSCV